MNIVALDVMGSWCGHKKDLNRDVGQLVHAAELPVAKV
jgi:hypothetical protein